MDESHPPIYYSELEPAAPIDRFVACYWLWRVETGVAPFIHTVPPDGSVSLWFSPAVGFGVTGPQVQPMRVPAQGGDRFWGVRFWPGAATVFLPLDSSALRNAGRILLNSDEHLWLDGVRSALSSDPDLSEAAGAWRSALSQRLVKEPVLDARALSAVVAILESDGVISVEHIAADIGISARQLRRRFRTATGLTPKELARICRVRNSLSDAFTGKNQEGWADVAAAHGFSDQAHMVHEYRRLVGETPSELIRYLRSIEHAGSIGSQA